MSKRFDHITAIADAKNLNSQARVFAEIPRMSEFDVVEGKQASHRAGRACECGVCSRMTEDEDLALDLWQGQFEFVGEGYDESAERPNGLRKGRVWCHHLTEQVQMLQQQVNVLADNQTNNDDRYTRAKQDSAALQARVLMLEEQLREAELRAEERLQEEQKRHRELMVRVEREKQLEIENVSIRLEAAETEAANQREEVSRLRNEILQLNWDNHSLLEQLHESESMLDALKSEADDFRELIRKLKEEVNHEKSTGSQLAAELALEVEELRKEQESHQCSRVFEATQEDMEARILELQVELNNLRQQNKALQESNEELQAQMLTRSVEEGRTLLTNSNSLAAEFEAMSQDDQKAGGEDHNSLEQMKSALKEQQEVNSQLRSYIDGILLNIVENYPQLLEVKTH